MLNCAWFQGIRFAKSGDGSADVVLVVSIGAGASEWVTGYLHVLTPPARRAAQAARREYTTTHRQIPLTTWVGFR
jgi:predicted alpha/beta-hydrolase family hydrolase